MKFIDHALAYARKGIPIFPLSPGEKTPMFKGGYKLATTDEEKVKEWWMNNPNANIGMPTGHRSGIIVVDVDVKNGANGFDTLTQDFDGVLDELEACIQQETPTGGVHFLLKMPPEDIRISAGKLGKGLDVRANGGYIVIAPSVISGLDNPYEWVTEQGLLDDITLYPLPELVDIELKKQIKPENNPNEKLFELPERLEKGSRNDVLFKFACSLRSKGGTVEEIFAALKSVRDSRTEDKQSIPDGEIKQIAESACGFEPKKKLTWDRTSSGKKRGTFNNCMNIFENTPEFAELIRYNQLSSRIEITKKPWWGDYGDYPRDFDDEDAKLLKAYFREQGIEPSINIINEAVDTIGLKNKYHPVRDYLKSLKWDGKSRLETWLTDYMGCPQTKLNSFIGQMMLVAACKRVERPGCQYDYMVILEGEQGIGKSQALQALSGEWYKSIDLTDRDTDTVQKMQGAWIIEVAEMVCFKRQEIESLKAFITTQVDHARFAYGKRDKGYARQSIFVGTINPETVGYLSDKTGNRRFVPVECGNIDVAGIKRDRDQLFAEAWVKYQKGFPIWFQDKELESMVTTEQQKREDVDGWQELIANGLSMRTDDYITIMQIYNDILGGTTKDYHVGVGRRIGAIMRKLGYKDKYMRNDKNVPVKVFDISSNNKQTWEE